MSAAVALDQEIREESDSPAFPLPPDESLRLKALEDYGVLDSAAEQAFDDLARVAALCCEVPVAWISLVDRHRQWFKARVGIDAREASRENSFCAHAIMAPDAVTTIRDARRDPRFANHEMVTGSSGIVFYAGAPLRVPGGQAIGALCVADRRSRELTDAQRQMLVGLAAQAITQFGLRRSVMRLESMIERQTRHVDRLQKQHQELAQENATDPLTGLGNRRAFQERLDLELAQADGAHSLALLTLDVDYFKRYNDSFGHPAGDTVLKRLAAVMRRACGPGEFAARLGGEEFAVILPGTTRERAFVMAERLRRSVQREAWQNRPVTVSVGVAFACPGANAALQVMEWADMALYRSKRDGRNRVTLVYGPGESRSQAADLPSPADS